MYTLPMGFFDQLMWLIRGGDAPGDDALQRSLEAWKIFTAQNGAVATVVRIRVDEPDDSLRKAMPDVVQVEWPFESEGSFPRPATLEEMNGFERALDELSTDNDLAELMMVRTGFGVREWVFYTRDANVLLSCFDRLLDGHPRYPIELHHGEDPAWTVWRETRDDLLHALERQDG